MKFKQPYYFQADPDDPGLPGGGNNDPEPSNEGQSWPDNWRELYAGEDEKKLSQLSRYTSPTAAFDGLIAAKQKLSSGELRSTAPYPDKGTEEEQNEWRNVNGVPLKAEEYVFDGYEITDEDKGFISSFQEYAYGKNIPKDQANHLIGFLLDQDQKELEAEKNADEQLKQQAEDKLRAEWGGDYRRNINVAKGLLDMAPEGVKDALLGARTSDGSPITTNPNLWQWLADMALQLNPAAPLIPAGDNPMSSIEDQISEIEKMMSRNDPAYWKDEKIQAKYRDLVAMRDKLKK
jgi:hypothetical protein